MINSNIKNFFKENKIEIFASLADFPLLFPLLIGLVKVSHINPLPTLLFYGFLYIITANYFDIPFPVQPLKAIAAISISKQLPSEIIFSSAFLIGIIFLVITPFLKFIIRFFSKPIILGIQMSLGFILLKVAISFIFQEIPLKFIYFNTNIGFFFFILIEILIILLFKNSKKIHVFIPLIIIGFFSTLIFGQPIGKYAYLSKDFSLNFLKISNLKIAFSTLVIHQIPLTFLNSIVATFNTFSFYFPEKSKKISYEKISLSIGIGNLLAGIFGFFPFCHGAGGLTAYYTFGGRTKKTTITTGLFLIIFSMIFYNKLWKFFFFFPLHILGLLLFYTGISHALLGCKVENWKEASVILSISFIFLYTENLAVATILGIFLDKIFYLLTK